MQTQLFNMLCELLRLRVYLYKNHYKELRENEENIRNMIKYYDLDDKRLAVCEIRTNRDLIQALECLISSVVAFDLDLTSGSDDLKLKEDYKKLMEEKRR